MYATVKNLPAVVQDALKSVGYGCADIRVEASEKVVLSSSGGSGTRNFATLINLTSNQFTTTFGSWGGSNMFTATAPDDDNRAYPLPADGCALTGSRGGGRPVYAVLHVPASMVNRMLPAPSEPLTEDERNALYCHKALKGGQYRKDEMRRLNVPTEAVDSLVARGFLKRNRAGAVAITTEGKNAFESAR